MINWNEKFPKFLFFFANFHNSKGLAPAQKYWKKNLQFINLE